MANKKEKIEHGDEVKHIHTGFKGVATSRTLYLSGCDRITVTPKVNKEGELKESMMFDEPELSVTKKKKVARNTKTGGDRPFSKHYLKT